MTRLSRYTDFFPSPSQEQLLLKLSEECGEVVQASCKTQLHGYTPLWKGVQYDNREDLMHELGDVLAIKDLLRETGMVDERTIDHYRQLKLRQLPRILGWPEVPEEEPLMRVVLQP